MKKLLLFLLLTGSLCAQQALVTQDPADPAGKKKVSTITTTNNSVITSTNCVSSSAVIGVTNSAGAGDFGKVVKLNGSGTIDSTMIAAATTSIVKRVALSTFTSSGSASTYSVVTNFTTTRTAGGVIINATATPVTAGTFWWIRLRDSNTNAVASTEINGTGGNIDSGNCTLVDVLAGSTKTYYFEIAASGTSAGFTNNFINGGLGPPHTNAFNFSILEIP